MEKDTFLLKIKIIQQLNAGDVAELLSSLEQLKELSPTEQFFSTQISDIAKNIPEDKVDDVLHAAKTLSRTSFMQLMNRLFEKKELTMEVIQNYKDQFGEDNDVLLAELTMLFGGGYAKNKKRIDEIMQVVA